MSSEIRIARFVSAFNICKAIKAPAGLVLKMPVNPYTRLFSSEINGMLSKPFAPETKVWETCTPCFETRNIHFYRPVKRTAVTVRISTACSVLRNCLNFLHDFSLNEKLG